jgi:LPS-assembly protein
MPRKNPSRRLLCAAVLAAIGLHPALAVEPSTTKSRPPSCPDLRLPEPAASLSAEQAADGRVHVYADRADAKLDETTTFSGHVELRRDHLHLFADEVSYHQADNSVSARGNIHLRHSGGETVLTPLLDYEFDTERGATGSAEFALAGGTGRGQADRLRFAGRESLSFESVRFTTCPPGKDDWFLRASTLTLDKQSETGTAKHAVIEFMHVPVFYSPYLRFPLTEERQSGFLAPHFGHTSKSGYLLSVPYYFNLASNYDDTLTARLLTDRGLQALNEFRYLGANYQGDLNLAYLADDRKTDTDREALFFRHSHSLSPRWSLSTDIQWVSDANYFIDLATGATEAARTHQPRVLRLDYGGSIWRFSGRAFTYQTLDTTIALADQPYQRLPQLLLTADAPGGANRPHYGLESEWVNFYRQGSVTGQRLDVLPSLSLPLRTEYFYFTPKAGYRYTAWRLDNATNDLTPERGLPVYSVDSGLALERDGRWFGAAYTQTLEPRLYYVHVPYKDQDNLPVFDAAVPDFSFYNFFRENRFVGADRVGDAEQLTAAVTSRFLAPESGTELARLSFGQVHYFEDQRVNLPAGTVTQTRSDLIGEVYARLGAPWYARAGLQWDNKERETRKASLYLNYRPAADRIVNLGYRLLNGATTAEQEQSDVSAQWPLAERWTGVARWNYSLPDARTLLAYAGLEYASCCWALRLTGRQRLLPDGNLDNSVLFEFELTGLARLGQTEESPLQQGRFIFE